jgi:methylamine dehydrogenase accessory protein MauD
VSFVIASQVLLWVGFGTLALICAALARQVGVLHQRLAPVGALALTQRLKVGDPAPEMRLSGLDGSLVSIGGRGRPKSQLLLFLSPDCVICETLLPAIRSAGTAERDWLEIVLASDGELEKHLEFVRERGLAKYPYVVSEQLGRGFGVSKVPYAVLIDESGIVAAAGLVNSREQLESLFVAKQHGVGNIQEFLKKRQTRTSSAE